MDERDAKIIEQLKAEAKPIKSGFYWSVIQQGELKIHNVKNFSTSNMYSMLGRIFGNVIGETNMNSTNFLNPITTRYIGNAQWIIIEQPSTSLPNDAMVVQAGTDTTTVSTSSMAELVAPATPNPDGVMTMLNQGTNMTFLLMEGTYSINSLGAPGTFTTLGEFGLVWRGSSSKAIINRLAVADGNPGFTTPITVNNDYPFYIIITLVI